MEKQIITIQDENGIAKQVEIVSIVPSKKEEKVYLVYTDANVNVQKNEFVDIYIANLYEDANGVNVKAIETDEEYLYAKSLLEEQLRGD